MAKPRRWRNLGGGRKTYSCEPVANQLRTQLQTQLQTTKDVELVQICSTSRIKNKVLLFNLDQAAEVCNCGIRAARGSQLGSQLGLQLWIVQKHERPWWQNLGGGRTWEVAKPRRWRNLGGGKT